MIRFLDGVDRKKVWDGFELARRAKVRHADLHVRDGVLWMLAAAPEFRIRWPVGLAESEVRVGVDVEFLESSLRMMSWIHGDGDLIPAWLEGQKLRIGEERPERPWAVAEINRIAEFFDFDEHIVRILPDSRIPDGPALLRDLTGMLGMRFEESSRFCGPWVVDLPSGLYGIAATPYSAVLRCYGHPTGLHLGIIIPARSLVVIEPALEHVRSVYFHGGAGWLILDCDPGILAVQVYMENLFSLASKLLERVVKPMPGRVGPVPMSELTKIMRAAKSHRHSAPPAFPLRLCHRDGRLMISVAHEDPDWKFESKVEVHGYAPDEMRVSWEQVWPVLRSMPEQEVHLEWDGELLRVSGESFTGLVAGMRR